ncbi:MAG TPA: IS1595 family transposase [Allosphingosinicella sp.]|nr:IS1595 family transposase [Allosphingosinicella sp.]
MSTKPLTIRQFFRQFPDDETCLQHLFEIRFGQGFPCPSCERPSNWYRIKAERAYSCQWCGHHLHPTVNTPFAKTRTPLQLWFYAIFMFTTTRNGVAAKELERQLGVTYKTAWRMADEIRKHMAEVDGDAPVGGLGKIVEIDETLVGGSKRSGWRAPRAGKTMVMGMLERDGAVLTAVVPDNRKHNLLPQITAHVAPGSICHTDELRSYKGISKLGFRHDTVNHTHRYVSVTGAHVQGIENFWAQLKRAINGTHIHVSGKHLWKYAKEAEYRFNRRECGETMLGELLTTFRPLS